MNSASSLINSAASEISRLLSAELSEEKGIMDEYAKTSSQALSEVQSAYDQCVNF